VQEDFANLGLLLAASIVSGRQWRAARLSRLEITQAKWTNLEVVSAPVL